MKARDLLRIRRRATSEPSPEPTDPPASGRPTFSILLPIYESDPVLLTRQLESIRWQAYPHWECIVVDDGSRDHRGLQLARELAAEDQRFKIHARSRNGGIAAATNDCLDRATTEWVVFCDHDDVIHLAALDRIAAHVRAHPDDDVVYTDEHLIDGRGEHLAEFRKPDWSPERFLGQNYFCHIVVMRRALVQRIGRLDAAAEPAADRDFNMRAVAAARSVGHVPEVLYSWRAVPGSIATATSEKPHLAEAVALTARRHLERTGERADVQGVDGDAATVTIRRPAVEADVVELAIDDDTSPAELDARLREAAGDIVVLAHPAAAGPPQWWEPLVALCARPHVAIVGPRLVTDDGRLVSAGRDHAPSITDLFQGQDASNPGPWGAFTLTREVAGLHPVGVVLDRRAVLDVGGLDIARLTGGTGPDDIGLPDALGLELTVAALCTALRVAGWPPLWTPLATLTLPDTFIRPDAHWSQLAAGQRMLAETFPDVAADPYSPVGAGRP